MPKLPPDARALELARLEENARWNRLLGDIQHYAGCDEHCQVVLAPFERTSEVVVRHFVGGVRFDHFYPDYTVEAKLNAAYGRTESLWYQATCDCKRDHIHVAEGARRAREEARAEEVH